MNKIVLTELKRAVLLNLEELALHILISNSRYLSIRDWQNFIEYMAKIKVQPYGVMQYVYYRSECGLTFWSWNRETRNCRFHRACGFGHTNEVRLLLKDERIDPSSANNYAIRLASEHGRVDIMRLLLADERIDPCAQDNEPIWIACNNGYTEIVRLLLADGRADPRTRDNIIICAAVSLGHTEIVRLLLADGRTDPCARTDRPLRNAVDNGNTDILRLLIKDDRVMRAYVTTYFRRCHRWVSIDIGNLLSRALTGENIDI